MYSVQTLLDVDQVPHGVSRPTVKHRAPAAEHTLEHRAPAAGHTLEHRAPAAGHTLEHRAPAAGHTLEHRAPATGHTLEHRAPAAGHTLEHRELNYKPKGTKLCNNVLHTVVRSCNLNYGPHRKTVFFSQNLISRKIKLL